MIILPQCEKQDRALLPLPVPASVYLLCWEVGLHGRDAEERDEPQGSLNAACPPKILPFH